MKTKTGFLETDALAALLADYHDTNGDADNALREMSLGELRNLYRTARRLMAQTWDMMEAKQKEGSAE